MLEKQKFLKSKNSQFPLTPAGTFTISTTAATKAQEREDIILFCADGDYFAPGATGCKESYTATEDYFYDSCYEEYDGHGRE